MIKVVDLKKYYGISRGIESVSLSVKPGEIFGFIGPNGAGKTTLIRILVGLLNKDSGLALVNNQEVHMNSPEINKEIGYLPSESNFFDDYKTTEMIKFFEDLRGIDSTYTNELIRRLNLDISKKVKALSFGNKKKLGIVIALMHKPNLLILDEPTTGLDPLAQKAFLDLMIEHKNMGATIFLSSHVLNDVQKVCDKVAFIKNGSVILTEDIETLKQQEHKKIIVSPIINIDIEGIKNVKMNNHSVEFEFHGDINHLLTELNKHPLKDLIIRNVTLEELFLKYYEDENHA